MSQDSAPVPSRRHDEFEISPAEILAPLHRHWKLVLGGAAASWALFLVALPLVPRLTPASYRCEAALSLPNLIGPSPGAESTPEERPWENGTTAGIPLGLYKTVERTLRDGAVLRSAFAGRLAPTTVDDHLSPLASSPQDDIRKMDKDEIITAVKLSSEAPSADAAREVVETLAGLVRDALITNIVREDISWEQRTSDEQRLSLVKRKADLLDINRSLEKLQADLVRLARDLPPGAATVSREIVDTRQGGHLFLPPNIQLIGAKASYVANEHTIRVYDQALARHALRQRFLRRLDERIQKAGAAVVPDLPLLLERELDDFLRAQGSSSDGSSSSLQAEMGAFADQLATLRNAMRFIQNPTTERLGSRFRASLAAALASLATIFFIAAAFVVDLWQRPR